MSELKAPYNVTVPNEIDNLRRWLEVAAVIIANLPDGDEYKEVFDVVYTKHRSARIIRENEEKVGQSRMDAGGKP